MAMVKVGTTVVIAEPVDGGADARWRVFALADGRVGQFIAGGLINQTANTAGDDADGRLQSALAWGVACARNHLGDALLTADNFELPSDD